MSQNHEANPLNHLPGRESAAQSTPYSRTHGEIVSILRKLHSDPAYRYLDRETNQAIGKLSIYKAAGQDPVSDVGRTLEADVFSQSAGYSPEYLEAYFSRYDPNSIFLIMVDESSRQPELAGVLRVIDCAGGESETIDFFKEFHGEATPVPPELAGLPGEKVWDVMSIVIDPRHRDGTKSTWLYHALYKMSLDEGVDRWISNIVPREIRNLRQRLGIPFADVPGLEPVSDVMPNGTQATYSFYYAEVAGLGQAVERRIQALESEARAAGAGEKEQRIKTLYARLARIAYYGE